MFPLCRKWQTMHGPHSSCCMTAETYVRRFQSRHSRRLRIFHLPNTSGPSLFLSHAESTIFLGSFLATSVLFFVLVMCSVVGYAGVRFCLRFQLRLAVYLIMLGRVPFEFKRVNKVVLFCLHVTFFLTGGVALLALSAIDM